VRPCVDSIYSILLHCTVILYSCSLIIRLVITIGPGIGLGSYPNLPDRPHFTIPKMGSVAASVP